MTLYSPFDSSSLPMLHPLLYLSPRLSPVRPYQTAVFARLLHSDINYLNHEPRWFVQPRHYSKSATDKQPGQTDKQSAVDKQYAIPSDSRLVFSEKEFQSIRDKYKMPKLVCAEATLLT